MSDSSSDIFSSEDEDSISISAFPPTCHPPAMQISLPPSSHFMDFHDRAQLTPISETSEMDEDEDEDEEQTPALDTASQTPSLTSASSVESYGNPKTLRRVGRSRKWYRAREESRQAKRKREQEQEQEMEMDLLDSGSESESEYSDSEEGY
ncbi:hypothetical protein GLOTRDRAFT_137489 [Gloeophyllum trabeum ATCC 11539]|uniref:Uncharacterized protein n=1 Tax=Gloeophyllum trabeum (strain ATCC 11539 / FP-39264 / Madison 617) TaxID=670483 RepID=S7RV24_GLOTA|nr:uncharacterized protein GLOTRDRAFT_137489 [Gloeophyllum trabeum ATCC 11539]EPQ57064.1 hypothetical protein GLOTRDRAFT_137489 [Gloeophyllum trabeum ATCC 11539]